LLASVKKRESVAEKLTNVRYATGRPSKQPVEEIHFPVLLEESLRLIDAIKGGFFIDATLGLGGHSEAILKANAANKVLGVDQDPAALELATQRLAVYGGRFKAVWANFETMSKVVKSSDLPRPIGILADTGVSSLQLDDPSRGFSFRANAPLDMRMSPVPGVETAAELLDRLSESEIADIIYNYGEERFSRRIAKRIIERREAGRPIGTTFELADVVRSAVPRSKKENIDPATRTFQALRIAVNRELDVLEPFIRESVDLLASGGVLAVISFHSLEDRIVKHTFQRLSGKCICPPRSPVCVCGAAKKGEVITKKPITASDMEVELNPRSRSAKLRGFRKF
jgi:16S rRNA (cytosine1402-N4)-methyltransferase